MQIIIKTRVLFSHSVMKIVLFPMVITIFKLIYLFWFHVEQTLPVLGVTRFMSASALRHGFSARFPGVVLLDWDDLFIPRHFQRLIRGNLTEVDPGRPRNLQRRKVEVTRWPKYSNKTADSNQQWIQEQRWNNTQIIMGACTWPNNSNLSQTANESKIFQSNVTTIKIKCSNNFPERYSVEITYTSLK